MKITLLFSCIFALGLVACSSPSTVTPQPTTPFNQVQTERLAGTWNFNYQIINNFTQVYTLTTTRESTSRPGEYYMAGTDQYGDLIVAGYDPKENDFSLLDPGTVIDRFFIFNITSGANTSVNGCYYQIDASTKEFSDCYSMTGVRVSSAVAPGAATDLGGQRSEVAQVAVRALSAPVPDAVRSAYERLVTQAR